MFGLGGIGSVYVIGYYDDELVCGVDGWKIVWRCYISICLKFLGLFFIILLWMVLCVFVIVFWRLNLVLVKNG